LHSTLQEFLGDGLAGGRVAVWWTTRLADALKSNEQFDMDDSFQLSISKFVNPLRNGCATSNQTGSQHHETFKLIKQSVVRIQTHEVLWCARALVTAEARVDKQSTYYSFRDGRNNKKEQALLLHHEGNVPFGPCGHKKLKLFGLASSL